MSRRQFLRLGLHAAGVAATPLLWNCGGRSSEGGPITPAPLPSLADLGPLQAADENGLMLPEGFSSRVVARSGLLVVGDLLSVLPGVYVWHTFPDGGATYPAADGGWVYVSNSEMPLVGGAGALRFDAEGRLVDSYPILRGTSLNCAGGPTPWGTWLSCEEHPTGRVHECDPFGGADDAQARPALGIFEHEAVAVDPVRKQLLMTEDIDDGRFYRFVCSAEDWPEGSARPALEAGRLQVLQVPGIADSRELPAGSAVKVRWLDALNPDQRQDQNRHPDSTLFAGGEGVWYANGIVYFTCKSGNRVWAYDAVAETLELLYDDDLYGGDQAPLRGVDNCVVFEDTGDLLVAEDGGDMRIVAIAADGRVLPILRLDGQDGSEITGPAFSPDGSRLYFSSQRGGPLAQGLTYEVSGPFQPGQPRTV